MGNYGICTVYVPYLYYIFTLCVQYVTCIMRNLCCMDRHLRTTWTELPYVILSLFGLFHGFMVESIVLYCFSKPCDVLIKTGERLSHRIV
jgi:hypothetical protein